MGLCALQRRVGVRVSAPGRAHGARRSAVESIDCDRRRHRDARRRRDRALRDRPRRIHQRRRSDRRRVRRLACEGDEYLLQSQPAALRFQSLARPASRRQRGGRPSSPRQPFPTTAAVFPEPDGVDHWNRDRVESISRTFISRRTISHGNSCSAAAERHNDDRASTERKREAHKRWRNDTG